MKIGNFAATLGLGIFLTSQANAAFITGSISFSDGYDEGALPTTPSTSIVSDLTVLDVNNTVNTYSPGSANGDFVGVTSALAFDVDTGALGTTFFTTDNGFTFTITQIALSGTNPLQCAQTLCGDSIAFNVGGIVSGGGFDDTTFLGNWTSQGTCLGGGTQCTRDISASWSSSLVATGDEPTVPVPGTLALLGLGMLGLRFARRRA